MFKTMNEDNNAYTEYYRRLKARGNIPTDYTGVVHHHHFRIKTDPLRDDNDFIVCTMEEHTELHKLMYECYPSDITERIYRLANCFKDSRGTKVKHTKKFYLKKTRKELMKVLQKVLRKKKIEEGKKKMKERGLVVYWGKHKRIIEEQEKKVYRQLGLL